MCTVTCPRDPSFPSHGLCCQQGAGAALCTPSGSGAFPCNGTCVRSSDLLWTFGPFAAQSQEATEMSIPLGPFADWVLGAGAGKAASPERNPCSGPWREGCSPRTLPETQACCPSPRLHEWLFREPCLSQSVHTILGVDIHGPYRC